MQLIGIFAFGLGLTTFGFQSVRSATLWQNQQQDPSLPAVNGDSTSVGSAQPILSDASPPSTPHAGQTKPLNALFSGGGCYRERCWTWCDFAHEMWCYTTQGTTWDGKHVECEADYECEEDWACAERCRHKDDRD